MGGYDSGRWDNYTKKRTVEDCWVPTLVMFAMMGAIAVVVYEKLGVMILKRTWFNLDLLWAGAPVGAGVITLFI